MGGGLNFLYLVYLDPTLRVVKNNCLTNSESTTRASGVLPGILDEVLETGNSVPPKPMDSTVFGPGINHALSEGEINLLDTTDLGFLTSGCF